MAQPFKGMRFVFVETFNLTFFHLVIGKIKGQNAPKRKCAPSALSVGFVMYYCAFKAFYLGQSPPIKNIFWRGRQICSESVYQEKTLSHDRGLLKRWPSSGCHIEPFCCDHIINC